MFSFERLGPCFRIIGTVNADVYLKLVEHASPSLEPSMNQPAIIVPDNAPRHTVKRVKNYFEQEDVQLIK